jgi:hypothetical protein
MNDITTGVSNSGSPRLVSQCQHAFNTTITHSMTTNYDLLQLDTLYYSFLIFNVIHNDFVHIVQP